METVVRANAVFIQPSGELFWCLSAKYTAQNIERIRQVLCPAMASWPMAAHTARFTARPTASCQSGNP
jgi:hypothetical protein